MWSCNPIHLLPASFLACYYYSSIREKKCTQFINWKNWNYSTFWNSSPRGKMLHKFGGVGVWKKSWFGVIILKARMWVHGYTLLVDPYSFSTKTFLSDVRLLAKFQWVHQNYLCLYFVHISQSPKFLISWCILLVGSRTIHRFRKRCHVYTCSSARHNNDSSWALAPSLTLIIRFARVDSTSFPPRFGWPSTHRPGDGSTISVFIILQRIHLRYAGYRSL